MLGLGLMLFCMRGLMPGSEWRTGGLRFSFWALNAGLFLMTVGSLLPVGMLQTAASVDQGTWYARSAEFMQTPLMQTLRWMRVPGDTLFALGALVLGWFLPGLLTGRSIVRPKVPSESEATADKRELVTAS